MTKVERLVARLREMGLDIPAERMHPRRGWGEGVPEHGRYVFQRTNAGHHQRSAGAWSWWIGWRTTTGGAVAEIGSPYSVTALLAAPGIEVRSARFGLSAEITPYPERYLFLPRVLGPTGLTGPSGPEEIPG